MALDWDDLLAYTTNKRVRIRHRWLGLAYYSFILFVIIYIFVVKITLPILNRDLLSRRDVKLHDVEGAVTASVYGPSKIKPDLSYCREPYVDNCTYPEMATSINSETVLGLEGALLIGTRRSNFVQHRTRACNSTDPWNCPVWVPEIGTHAAKEASINEFIADAESSTIMFQQTTNFSYVFLIYND